MSILQAEQIVVHARVSPGVETAPPRPATAWRRLASGLQLSVSHDLQTVEHEWRRFEQHADCTVFQCFDWLGTWQKHIGMRTGTLPTIVVGRRGLEPPLFILPLAVARSGGIRRLTFLGRELCDYNAPLLARAFTGIVDAGFPSLWQEIRDILQSDERTRHDVILLDKMPERVGAQANPFLQLPVCLHPSGAYVTHLKGDWESFYAAKRSSATRRRDRSKRKRLAESGEVRMVTTVARDETARTLTTLMVQKARAFARMGVVDIFARPGHREFYLDLATSAQTPGLVHVSRLEIGSTFAAVNLGLEFRGGYSHVLASYDDGTLARFGPGAAHLHELMRYALERGCTYFDFTIGDEPYKRDWCDVELKLYDHVAAATTRGRAAAALLDAARALKRRIKQSSLLWPLVIRLRAAFGSWKKCAAPPASTEADDKPHV